MIEFFNTLNPIGQAFIGTCFTWSITALGAATVFLGSGTNKKVLDTMLGFAGGVMIAASFWSLLAPAIALSTGGALPSWFPAVVGFLCGGLFLRLLDRLLPHIHPAYPVDQVEGVKSHFHRTTLLVLAVTLHNFPEGLAIGVAFGAVAAKLPHATLAGAIALTIGIGIQNFPEGIAVAMPLRRRGMTKFKSFWYGQLSGVVEIIAGVAGASAVLLARPLLPYGLSFAAGAMIYVVIEAVIPESQRSGNTDLSTVGAIIGFAVMMILDVGLG